MVPGSPQPERVSAASMRRRADCWFCDGDNGSEQPAIGLMWCQEFGYHNSSDLNGVWGNRRIVARSNLSASPVEPNDFDINNRIAEAGWQYDNSGNVIKNPLNQTF